MPMNLVEAVAALHAARTDRDIVVTTMGSAREWLKLSEHPCDLAYAPSSMGQAPTVGLGLALAQPQRQVIVGNGDGCMLMNLGCLVTLTAAQVRNLVLIVFDNGVYEVTGIQPTAGSADWRGRGDSSSPVPRVDFTRIATGCGFTRTFEFDDLAAWKSQVDQVIHAPGPTFVTLRVHPVVGGTVPRHTKPAPARGEALRAALSKVS